ncbi:MAG: family 43 glycosylhydrolase [Chloroflexi bacterium]|nr:family 43 glycosylhydrolase [Chloroflexota bacterium]MCC6897228.1 family 43 glycosylhydrolase [Anaerolineae bacterium]
MMKWISLLAHTVQTALWLVLGVVILGAGSQPTAAQTPPGSLHNPLNTVEGADPWLTYYDGNYYLATTTGTSQWYMLKSPTLSGLKIAIPQLIYTDTDPSRGFNFWAPEFHLLEGDDGEMHWYFYYSAGTSGTFDNQRSHVLESEGTDPLGPYHYKARIFDPDNDVYSIDGSILTMDDKLYFLFSSWTGDYQMLYIAPMSNPWTISGPRHLLTQSEYSWERSGLNVTEGPEALYHDDKTFIVYSGSFCATPDYALGLLTYNGGDVLEASSWDKSPEPVFQRSDENGVFGPGHNGFFKSPDGTEDWLVYHANDAAEDGCGGTRTTRVQKFTWNEDGTPNFGVPVSITTDIPNPSGDTGNDPLPQREALPGVRLAAYSDPTRYANHFSQRGKVSKLGEPAGDFEFIFREGLADPTAISIESKNNPNYYFINRNGNIWLARYDDTDDYRSRATFRQVPGLAGEDGVSFESVFEPGKYIIFQNGFLNVAEATTDEAKAAATFIVEDVEE